MKGFTISENVKPIKGYKQKLWQHFFLWNIREIDKY